jgi:hypothetical protein
VARGGGIAAGPIPGPMALVSCLFRNRVNDRHRVEERERGRTGQDLLHDE